VLFEPVLDVCAVVGVAVSSDDRVVHQRALERHVLEIFCGGTASGALQLRALEHVPGGSGSALPADVRALIALKLAMKEKTKVDFVGE
jgi:hypothetical protein